MESLLNLGFPRRYEARILRTIAETLILLGEFDAAKKAFREALKKDPAMRNTVNLKRKLQV
jgi:tetratricopeptide (TPR) repeat protein